MGEPVFSAPRKRKVVLRYPMYVKGKGMPKEGVCLFADGEEITIQTDNGTEWYTVGVYQGKGIRIAISPYIIGY